MDIKKNSKTFLPVLPFVYGGSGGIRKERERRISEALKIKRASPNLLSQSSQQKADEQNEGIKKREKSPVFL